MGNSNSKTDSIKASSQIIVVNHMYSSHYKIIKYISFNSIYYAINLDIMSFFKIFSKFDHIFISNVFPKFFYYLTFQNNKRVIIYYK